MEFLHREGARHLGDDPKRHEVGVLRQFRVQQQAGGVESTRGEREEVQEGVVEEQEAVTADGPEAVPADLDGLIAYANAHRDDWAKWSVSVSVRVPGFAQDITTVHSAVG